jgi:hypothetical protein
MTSMKRGLPLFKKPGMRLILTFGSIFRASVQQTSPRTKRLTVSYGYEPARRPKDQRK